MLVNLTGVAVTISFRHYLEVSCQVLTGFITSSGIFEGGVDLLVYRLRGGFADL